MQVAAVVLAIRRKEMAAQVAAAMVAPAAHKAEQVEPQI
jgi:hypothetical protein